MNKVMTRNRESEKREAQKQWDNDPCGAVTVEGETPGTLEFYRAARNYRYGVYGPWFNSVIRFSEWKGKDILEIGVGLGSDHFQFAKNGNRMVALDLSREHLRHTARHLTLENLATRPVLGDAESIPFPNETFDLVYAFGVLHHTPNTESAISEVRRVLKPGGHALIALYHRNSFFFWGYTVLLRGILRRGLWKKSWDQLLSEIEYRSNPRSALPLVKVYSRRQARALFHQFSDVDITTCHVNPGLRFLEIPPMKNICENLLAMFGWYIVIRAEK